MGQLHYGRRAITMDDRVLAHVQVVIVNRLRRGDSFTLSWLNALSRGDGRGSIWLSPSIPLEFEFSGSRSPEISREWIDALDRTVSGSQGLIVLGEDGRPARCG